MTESQSPQAMERVGQHSEMPDAFVAQVHDLLTHLYDLPRLQEVPFVQERATAQARPLRVAALAAKQEVLEVLETLNPGRALYFRAPEARAYNIILLHHVERYTVQKAADELGISERQAYRELRQAETSLAQLLWQQHQETTLTSAIQGSIAQRMETGIVEVADVNDLLVAAVEVVRPLASSSAVTLNQASEHRPVLLALNVPAARQVLIHLLSRAVKGAERVVTVDLSGEDQQFQIAIQYTLRPSVPESARQPDPVILPLLDQLGWTVTHTTRGVNLHLPRPTLQKTLLCIDDDPGFSELLRRYVTGLPVQIVSAASGQQGIEQAIQMSPDLIVLDVMMAGLDGWETLQHLRTHVATQHLPVVVCSVFYDPELAQSLGATAMLPKPLARAAFIQVLQKMGGL